MFAFRRMFSLMLLCALLVAPAAFAQEQTLAERDVWLSQQKLVRGALKVEVAQSGQAGEAFWLFFERTPHGRIRMLVADSAQAKPRLTYLIHDTTVLGIAGEHVFSPGAPWMLGQYLFGQTLEPGMLVNWVAGLPGVDYQVGAELAQVEVAEGLDVVGIEQAGWAVRYEAWKNASATQPRLPVSMVMTGRDVEVRVSVEKLETYTQPPAGYSEFQIM